MILQISVETNLKEIYASHLRIVERKLQSKFDSKIYKYSSSHVTESILSI